MLNSFKTLYSALATALLSTLLFILGCHQAGIASALSLNSQWLMVAGHLFGAFGNGVLLWIATSAFSEMVNRKNHWLCSVAVFVTAYHLIAAMGYSVGFRYDFFYITLLLWGLKTILCLYAAFDFMTLGDGLLEAIGLTLLVASLSGSPFALPAGWGIAQWILAKLTALLLAILLYWNNSDEIAKDD